MRSKILSGAAAFALATAAGTVTTGPASAQSWPGNRGNMRANPAANVVDVYAAATAPLPSWGTRYYDYYAGYYDPGHTSVSGCADAPNYAYTLRYDDALLYGSYGAHDWRLWSHRGGLRRADREEASSFARHSLRASLAPVGCDIGSF